ncbi:ferritin-like domain-containing protein [Falsiroseomonas sp. HW251]|uniref:ferritin-like domain-containing protein n=1 Tax=Falsiroseomonas sp. HW251 TaxID=3390998 RepID=UPI003D31F475
MASSIRDIYIAGLSNAHALEAQAIQLCNRQVERLENYPEMRERLREHAEESRRQQERIDQLLQALGTSPSTLKDIGTSIMGNLAAMGHALAQDEVIKNTFANYAFEHFEIASYRALIEMAQAAGDSAAPKLLEQSLNEEIRMAQWIEQHLSPTVRRYMQLEASGQKSGV